MFSKHSQSFVASVTAMIFAAAFFAGCDGKGQYSDNKNETVPHKTLKPPIDDGTDSEQLTEFSGTIVESTQTTLRITGSDEVQYEFMVTPDTAVTVNQNVAAFGDLMPGQKVLVMARVQEDLMTAREIRASDENQGIDDNTNAATDSSDTESGQKQIAEDIRVEGTIDSAGELLTVTDSIENVHTFEFTEQTRITLDGEEAAKANLQAGQLVVVQANADRQATNIDARSIK